MNSVPIVLVPRNEVYKNALMRILEKERSIRLITSSDHVLPLPANPNSKQQVVLFDVGFRQISFNDYAALLVRRDLRPRILLYGEPTTDSDLLFYLSRGAHGFLEEDQFTSMLITAIKHVAAGSLWIPHKVVARFVETVVSEMGHVSRLFRVQSDVSARERQVWTLISKGYANKEIASQLQITERTVKFHVTQLLGKFQVTNRRELMLQFNSLDQQAGIARAITRSG
jgi:DNA-binding NarL/FixJ family response regulator